MRLHQLEISGFLAYGGKETIDFDHLSEAGFFLIHGQTGAGKTSLLDAIAFAIFGSLPGARKDVKSLRSDHAADETETYVVLDATVGERRLRIRRRPKYELDRPDGKPKKIDASLTVEQMVGTDWMPVDATKQGAGTEISRWIGLKDDQFFRMALIPQGAFADFMHASSKQREAVLKELFAVDQKVFQEIEEYFDRQLKKASNEKTEAETKLGNERARIAQVLVSDGVAADQVVDVAWIDAKIELASAALASAMTARDHSKQQWDVAREAETAARAFIEASQKYRDAAKEAEIAAKSRADLRNAMVDLVSADIVDAAAEEQLELLHRNAETDLSSVTVRNGRVHEVDAHREAARSAQESLDANTAAIEEIGLAVAAATPELETLALKAASGLLEAAKVEAATNAFGVATELLLKVQTRDRAQAEITALHAAKVNADALAAAAEQVLADAEQAQRSQFAVILAGDLKQGEPCLVCGSLEHPSPMQPGEAWHAAAEAIDAARAERDRLVLACGKALTDFATAQNRVTDRQTELGEQAELNEADAASTLEQARTGLAELRASIDAAQLAEKSRQTLASGQTAREAQRGLLIAGAPALQLALATAKSALEALERDLGIDAGALAVVEDETPYLNKVQRVAKARSDLRTAIDACNAANAALAAVTTGADATLPDLDLLHANTVGLELAHDQAATSATHLGAVAKALRDRRSAFASAVSAHEHASVRYDEVASLARPLNGAGRSRTKLTQFYLSARLRQVLESANSRLHRMTDGRFLFVFDESAKGRGYQSLEIAVHDAWNGAQREVTSLSGGETFTASLALALGLADIVQAEAGGTALDSLFIDEGFGTLSPDFLGRVVEDLDRLRAGGRLVGIISHVEDLKQRIPVQLEVIKGPTGSTVRQVIDDER